MEIYANVENLLLDASIEISADKDEFIKLGLALIEVKKLLEISLKKETSTYYPISLSSLIFKVDDLISTIIIKGEVIEFLSNQDALARLGRSMINVVKGCNSRSCHFHIDKHDGFFDSTDHDLVFIARS